MDHLYHLIAKTEHREIEWNYDDCRRAAVRAFRQIVETGRTHDTAEPVVQVALYRDGKRQNLWCRSADVIPFPFGRKE